MLVTQMGVNILNVEFPCVLEELAEQTDELKEVYEKKRELQGQVDRLTEENKAIVAAGMKQAETIKSMTATAGTAGVWHYPPFDIMPFEGSIVEYDSPDTKELLTRYRSKHAGSFGGWAADSIKRWRYPIASQPAAGTDV